MSKELNVGNKKILTAKMILSQEHIKHIVKNYFKDKPVKNVYLFGSYANGSANENSDIDLLIEIDKNKKVGLQFYLWTDELKSITGHNVDLLSKVQKPEHTNDWAFLKNIEKQSTLVYEKEGK